MRHLLILCAIILSFLLADISYAQKDTTSTYQFPDSVDYSFKPVEVLGFLNKFNNFELPVAVTSVNNADFINGSKMLTIKNSLIHVPGVVVSNNENFAQDLRLSIRGFGSRSAFGIRGIKLLVDGYPETTPDGQSQVDNIDPSLIEYSEIYRGSQSSVYGNAAGGVVNLFSYKYPEKQLFKLNLTRGSFGYDKVTTSFGNKIKNLQFLVTGIVNKYEGYRDHSQFKNSIINAKTSFKFKDKSQIELNINHSSSPYAYDPGSLTSDQVNINRTSARVNNLDYDSGENVTQNRIGVHYNKILSKKTSFDLRSFYVERNFANKLPFENGGQIDIDRFWWGVSSTYKYATIIKNIQWLTAVGVEFSAQSDNRERYNNLQGLRGNKVFDQNESFESQSFFFQQNVIFSPAFRLLAGLRYDSNQLTAKDFFLINGNGSGEINLNNLSPILSYSYRYGDFLNLYMSISNHYETPTLNELSNNPSTESIGGFNPNLNAQIAKNYEIGTKGFFKSKFSYDVALYHSRTANEIVPYELQNQESKTYYRNAGSTKRNGIEGMIKYQHNNRLLFNLSTSLSNYVYADYVADDISYKGNHLPGLPELTMYIDAVYSTFSGFYVAFSNYYKSEYYADDRNNMKIPKSTLSNIRFGTSITKYNLKIEPFLGLNNIFDQEYFSNIRLNAYGKRYFEPAPKFNVHFGVTVTSI